MLIFVENDKILTKFRDISTRRSVNFLNIIYLKLNYRLKILNYFTLFNFNISIS